MADVSDMELMQEYADRNSESAFAELVRRHINLVYSVALRFTGNSGDAQDVTQAVFIIFARKAANLRQRMALTGWLYETTRFTARQLLRTKTRQHAREQEAYVQSTLNDSETDGAWKQLEPLLEEAMTRLNEKERALLALRFFENKTGAETASLLGIHEWAAHKRVNRAVEKLRKFFTNRGIIFSAAILTTAISANSVQAAPVALAKTVTAVAIAKGAAASGSTLILIKGALKIMAWNKVKTAVVAGTVLILAAGSSMVTVSQVKKHHESKIINAFIEKQDNTFSEERDPEFRKVRELGVDAVPYLVAAIKKYNSVRDTPPNPKSGHAEGRDLIRIRAYWALRGLGSSSKSALPFLIQQFSSNNDLIDFDYEVLARLGPEAREAIPTLAQAFHGTDSQMRFYAARALAKIDPTNPELMPTMLADLKSSDVVSRRFACHVLGELGTKAKSAVPALTDAFNDEDGDVRINATNALQKITGQMPVLGDR